MSDSQTTKLAALSLLLFLCGCEVGVDLTPDMAKKAQMCFAKGLDVEVYDNWDVACYSNEQVVK